MGVGNVDIIEKVQLKFFKQIFHLKNATPSYMIYDELEITPHYVEIQKRIVSLWCKLIDNYENNKLSCQGNTPKTQRCFYSEMVFSGLAVILFVPCNHGTNGTTAKFVVLYIPYVF